MISTGIADTSYWGPEAEFYIFDDIRFGQDQNSGFYFVDSVEGAWNSGEFEEGGNLGYKPRYKEGYFPVPPTDHFQDLRSEMTVRLEDAGIEIEVSTMRWEQPGRPRSICVTTRCCVPPTT